MYDLKFSFCNDRFVLKPNPGLICISSFLLNKFLHFQAVSLLLHLPPRMPSRKGSSEHDDNGDAQSKHRPRRSHGRSRSIIITIIVIISQMRRAKLELCLSPSGWLTVTNSSLIHSTHQLYTGQRSPVRQEAVKAPLHVSPSRELQCKYIVQLSSSMTFFVLSESRRQLVIMPSTTAATCGCYVSHCEVRFKSRD